jgi:uncharacterized membrane protein
MPRLSAVTAQACAISALVALIFLCLLWESVVAPIKAGGSLLMLKALPLLAPLFGLLRGRLYTFRWTPFLSLAYLCEGCVRAWSETGTARVLAWTEILLSATLLVCTLAYVHASRPSRSIRTG